MFWFFEDATEYTFTSLTDELDAALTDEAGNPLQSKDES